MAAPVLQFKRGLLANLPGLRAGEPGFTTDSYDLYVGIDSTTTNNKFFGSHRYWTRGTATTGSGVNLVEGTNNGTQYITLKSPDALAGIVTYVLPGTQGSPTSVLTNDGSGNLSWASGSNNATFTGITTFTDGTDNTLGNADTGSVQIDGGVGINKNLTVGANLNVQGYSEFVGVVTFRGGTINLGDASGDNITVGGRFASNLTPNLDNTYDVGISTLNWRHAHFSGIGTFETGAVIDGVQIGINGTNVIDTVSGNLTLNSAGGTTIIDDFVTIQNNLNVNGNVTIGGTTVVLTGQDVFIQNKDIVLGYSTNPSNVDNSTDTTANHGGVAVASTEGTPLANFNVSGINTLPSTYKQMMWFKSGTLGFSTDAFGFNYGVAIGTTQMANGVRLAVGSGVTMGDTSVTAATGNFTNLNGSLVGTISTATRATLVDTTGTSTNADYYATFVDTLAGQTSETLRVGVGVSVNPSDGSVKTTGTLSVGNPSNTTSYIKAGGGSNAMYLYGNGDVSFQAKVIANNIRSSSNSSDTLTLSDLDASFARNLYIAGITTVNNNFNVAGVTTTQHLRVVGFTTIVNESVTGVSTIGTLAVTGVTTSQHLLVTGVTTVSGAFNANGSVTLGDASGDVITVNGTATFGPAITGTISTATRATTLDTVTASDLAATHYLTFVNSHNATAATETVYTDDGIYYNPGTNTFTTQHALLTGNLTVSGVSTFTGSVTGTISTATRSTLVDTTTAPSGTFYPGLFVSSTGTASTAVYVDAGISYVSNTDTLTLTGDIAVNGGDVTTSATTFNLINGTATSVNFAGAATALVMGATTGIATISNPTVVGTQATQNLYNSVATNLNFGGAATALVMGAATGITTVSNNLTVGGDIRVNGSDIQASDGNTNITLTSNTLTTFAGDIRVNGNDIQASDGNANITMTSNTLTAFAGDIRVNGNDIQSSTGANVITLATNNATFANDVTVNGNLYVSGNTTQVNTAALTVEDRTIDLGIVNGAAPSANTTWDLGVLFNYYTGGAAKKSAVIWEHGDSRFKFASVLGSDTDGTNNDTPQLTVTTFAPIEISELWVNSSCTSNTSTRVVGCTGSTLILENVTIDGGAF